MEPAIVTAFEHQVLTVGNGHEAMLRPHEATRLLELGASRPGFCTAGHQSVRLAQYAGLVNLGGRMLEVLPKVGEDAGMAGSRGTFLRMLKLASDVKLFSRESASHDVARQSLLGVFVSAFLDELVYLVRSGLLRRYHNRTDDLRLVRGRLQVARQVAVHGMRPDLLACRFDELTADNPWNQVLVSALVKVRPWIDSVADGRRWLDLASAFDGVSPREDALTLLHALIPDRQARRYAAALRWADLILRVLSPNVRSGEMEAPECLFDMNRLFESSVAATLRRGGRGKGLQVSTQERGRFLARLVTPGDKWMFRLRPDLVIRDAAGVVAVGDTKWTRITADAHGWLAPQESHIYQMHAYSSAFPARDLYLVYPWHAGLEPAQTTSLRLPSASGGDVLLHVICVDVGEDGFPQRGGCEHWQRLIG